MTATAILDEILTRMGALPSAARQDLREEAMAATAHLKWIPSPGPQTEAYYSEADELLFGGEPGGGKSQLILGLAFNRHRQSMIFRREYSDLEQLIDDALVIHGSRDGFKGSPPPRLRIGNDQTIWFRAAQRVGDEQGTMGQGRDFLGVDEATHFAETQVRFLMGWVRSATPGQRCRVVLATNPPLTAEGLWVNKMFAPWLDPVYPFPAKPGELRWYITDDDGRDVWVDGPEDTRIVLDQETRPKSRTYIPSSVTDNPWYAGTDYEHNLRAMQEPFRSLLLGGFQTAFKDQDFQVIPTEWIRAAQARWTEDGWRAKAMTCMALDPAGGGRDSEVLARRHGGWYAPVIDERGPQTADGTRACALISQHRRNACPVVVDVGGGYAGAVCLRMDDNGIPYTRFDGAGATSLRARNTGQPLSNARTAAWWGFREELDPDQDGGSVIALPPDPEMVADLASLTFSVGSRGLAVEDKDHVRKRLGRSPGKGDAVVMAARPGQQAAQRFMDMGRTPQVIQSRAAARRH